MVGDALQKFKSTVNRGVTTISVKTSSSLEKAKINTHIESIDKEIEALVFEIGKATYEIWEKEDRDFSILYDKCTIVKQKQNEIIRLKEQYNTIDERDGQILGTLNEENKSVANTVPAQEGVIMCSMCGSVYIESVKFCRKCGQKLQE